MRALILGLTVSLTLAALPARAQVDKPTPAPIIDAAAESWQMNSEPMLFEGNVYLPAGPTRFFDGNTMVPTGAYHGIPVYQDKAMEPWSVIYVPVALGQMRPYERKRTGELAGTAAPRTPSFVGDVVVPKPFSWEDVIRPRTPVSPVEPTPEPIPVTRGKSATAGSNGIYIEYNGAKWYGSGRPVSYSSLFEPAGIYDGIVVYHLKTDHKTRVWVPVVPGGPLAPYSKR